MLTQHCPRHSGSMVGSAPDVKMWARFILNRLVLGPEAAQVAITEFGNIGTIMQSLSQNSADIDAAIESYDPVSPRGTNIVRTAHRSVRSGRPSARLVPTPPPCVAVACTTLLLVPWPLQVDGLQKGWDALTSNASRADAEKVLFLLSDGEPSGGVDANGAQRHVTRRSTICRGGNALTISS